MFLHHTHRAVPVKTGTGTLHLWMMEVSSQCCCRTSTHSYPKVCGKYNVVRISIYNQDTKQTAFLVLNDGRFLPDISDVEHQYAFRYLQQSNIIKYHIDPINSFSRDTTFERSKLKNPLGNIQLQIKYLLPATVFFFKFVFQNRKLARECNDFFS